MLQFLLTNASPSIRLRILKELGDGSNTLDSEAEQNLLSAIEAERNMQVILNSRQPDGWIGNAFHGSSAKLQAGMFDNMEVGLRYAAEKGLPADHPLINHAVKALLTRDRFDPAYMHLGKIIDYASTAIDLRLIRSAILIRVGYEDRLPPHGEINLKDDVAYSLRTFFRVLDVDDIASIIRPHKQQLVFVDGTVWPCIYDLRTLAYSQSWRSEDNYRMFALAVDKLLGFPQTGPNIYTLVALLKKKQVMAPCFAFIHRPIVEPWEDGIAPAAWFERMELLARCGIVHRVPQLMDEYERMLTYIGNDGVCRLPIHNTYFRKWGPYYGLALEPDWRTERKRLCDISFRALMIAYYTEKYMSEASNR